MQTWKFVDTFMTSFVETFMTSFEIICSEIRDLCRTLSNTCEEAFSGKSWRLKTVNIFRKRLHCLISLSNKPLTTTGPKNLKPLNFLMFSRKSNYKEIKAQFQFTHLEMSVTSPINSQNFIKSFFKVLQTLT